MVMGTRYLGAALGLAALLATAGAAHAQPQTKLASLMDKASIQAMWCSALLLEESYLYDEDSEDAVYYEDLAFELGDKVDLVLEALGLHELEIEELWEIYDEAAFELWLDDEDAYYEQLIACEQGYDDLQP